MPGMRNAEIKSIQDGRFITFEVCLLQDAAVIRQQEFATLTPQTFAFISAWVERGKVIY